MFRTILVALGLAICLFVTVRIQRSSLNWIASPQSADSPTGAIELYVVHFRAMIENFNGMAELIETIDDAESAEKVFPAVDVQCDEISSLLENANSLPRMDHTQSARLLEIFESELQEEFHSSTNRLLASAVRANDHAHGTPAMTKLSERIRQLATEIDAAMSLIEH